jgi:hypothetical protein
MDRAVPQMSRPSRWLFAALSALMLACGGDDSNGPGSASMTKAAGDNMAGYAGNFAPALPTVRVRGGNGAPVPDVPVTFRVTSGGGTVSFPSAVTDDSGRASPGAWRLGVVGAQGLTADASGYGSVTFTASAGAPPASAFDIDIIFLDPQPTDSQKAAFLAARDRWQQLIVGDLSDYGPGFAADAACPTFTTPEVPGPIDDVVIFAAVRPIPPDGGANILAQAGPCQLRGSNLLTIAGIMIFDSDDIGTLTQSASLADVATHEMAHVLGFGLIWSDLELITGELGTDPYFTGVGARQAFRAIQSESNPYDGNSVPVENTGGAGTRDGHWRETVFGRELMTGFFNGGVTNPLSAVTATSMRDMGYTVDDSRADAYQLSLAMGNLAAGAVGDWREQLAPWPVLVVDDRGRTLRAIRR